MTKPGSKLRARAFAPAAGGVLLLIATASFSGCFVSFDGYQLAEGGGAAGDSALGGRPDSGESGHANGGSAGKPTSGGASGAGAPSGGNASSGAPSGGNASSGAPSGGNASSGAPSGGSGGTSGGGAGGASAGTSGTAGSAGSGGTTTHCPAGKTNRLSQQVPLPAGGYYCIDYSEVRGGDYKAFLDANPGAPGQTGVCAFNNDYAPTSAAVTATCNQYDPVNRPSLPIACVDWCDADAFCKWDGKHLCGKLGGGSNAPADFADATKSAWYRACSHNGDYDFPYGSTYNGDICVGVDNSAIHPVSTPHTDCVGKGYDGLYDMSGNVAEWEDSCSGTSGATDSCMDRGGSYLDSSAPVGQSPSLQCNSGTHGSPQMATKPRSTRDKEIGFRCCSEPVP